MTGMVNAVVSTLGRSATTSRRSLARTYASQPRGGSYEFHPLQCGRGKEELVLDPELGEGRENPDLRLLLEDVVQAVRQVVDAGEPTP